MGAGETISHLADALSGDPELAASSGFADPAIGYEYEYFSLFFLDLWTAGGQLVLHDEASDRYVPFEDEVLRELTGRTADPLGVPFLHRAPLGWIVIGLVLAVAGVTTWRRMRNLP
ncbi:MAG TPA: hypothetical protein VIL20_29645 [Sandaracinaceae bacterium]